jgi:hypothetical protein
MKHTEALIKYNNSNYSKYKIYWGISVFCILLLCLKNLIVHFNLINFLFFYIGGDLMSSVWHIFMDNCTYYSIPFFGTSIADFQLHHRYIHYKKYNLFYNLLIEIADNRFISILLIIFYSLEINKIISVKTLYLFTSMMAGYILSDFTHYFCHERQRAPKIIKLMQDYNIILSPEHHKIHHIGDNINYGALTGHTDIITNFIVKNIFSYKKNVDPYITMNISDESKRTT